MRIRHSLVRTSRGAITIVIATLLSCAASAASSIPVPIHKVAPYFPIEAAEQKTSGDVTISASVDSDGEVKRFNIIFETPVQLGFAKSAGTAVKAWTFAPGHPGTYFAKIHFALDPELSAPTAPLAVQRANPRYPWKAWQANTAGDVIMLLDIDDTGIPTKVDIYQEVPEQMGFGAAAAKAVKASRHPPGMAGHYLSIMRFRFE